ncbi:hypothetical protein NA57DRAFT_70820 [Rhizodiscina lignyota]|uniref:Uncharacterized protein n=1 Tax=Rhizodiscina lignyota TaxID=1504668 RepID=A0A9P4IRA2_9PEZI|nr:hypothetical protein NA57DRAFT_70820 [Rhizodiscina lignyota]
MENPMYSSLDESSNIDSVEEKELFLPREGNRLLDRRALPWPWIVSTLFFAALSTVLMAWLWFTTTSRFSFSTGFSTDFEPSRSTVQLETLRFTGGLELDDNNTLFRVVESNLPQYVGTPTREIDENWHNLMRGLEIVVDGDEASTVYDKTLEEPEGGHYRMSLDIYHSLHCVNMVRKGIDKEYYHPDGKIPYFYRIHIDHCIDYLRQAIQCQGDLTPLYYYKIHDPEATIPIFGGEHTCRNFGAIDRWALDQKRCGYPGCR